MGNKQQLEQSMLEQPMLRLLTRYTFRFASRSEALSKSPLAVS